MIDTDVTGLASSLRLFVDGQQRRDYVHSSTCQRNSGSWMLTGERSQLHPFPQDAFLDQNRAQLLARNW
ncbi:hypothetical protein LEMLEM_LOCUS15419, partial [Lemmus lemmus]